VATDHSDGESEEGEHWAFYFRRLEGPADGSEVLVGSGVLPGLEVLVGSDVLVGGEGG